LHIACLISLIVDNLFDLLGQKGWQTPIFVTRKDKKTMMNENKQQGLEIDLDAEVAQGHYSNLAIISHSTSEFIIDFATMLPGLPKPEVGNRIIMTPEHAKRLFLALQDNLNKYESQHGQISLGGEPKQTFPMGGLGGGAKS
jgi:hypothetical protein